jgi:hypothetical protein
VYSTLSFYKHSICMCIIIIITEYIHDWTCRSKGEDKTKLSPWSECM